LFLNIEQVIPLPEAEELMIGISEKEVEEQSSERGQATRHQLRTDFWHMALGALRKANVLLYANVNPGKDPWLNAGSGLGGIYYAMIFNKGEVRVNFVLNRAAREQNKVLFDALLEQCDAIDAAFGSTLD
jgi:hypothetical protein